MVPQTVSRRPNELSRPLKLAWLKQLQDQLQLPNSPQSLSRVFRPWFFLRHRRVSIVLHRLRNRHNRLKTIPPVSRLSGTTSMVLSETDFADSVALPSKTPLMSSSYALISIPPGLPSNGSSNSTA